MNTLRIAGAFAEIWVNRKLLLNTVVTDIRLQYSGTTLGMLWVVLGPVLLLFLYSMIYVVIFQVRIPNYTVGEYVLNVFAGLVPFLAFASGLSLSASVARSQRKLFYSNYPKILIPIKSILVAYVMLIVGVVLLVIGDFMFSTPSAALFLVPVVALFQVMFSIGLGMYLCLLGLIVKDIEFLIQYTVIALLIVTPIAYTPEMIPAGLEPLLYFNPLFYYVSAMQHLVLLNALPPIHIVAIGILLAFGMLVSGIWFYNRAQPVIGDLL